MEDERKNRAAEDSDEEETTRIGSDSLASLNIEQAPALGKLGGSGLGVQLMADADEFDAIVKVLEEGYKPDYVECRAEIAPCLITARVRKGDLAALEADPKVVSVEASTRLPSSDREDD